MGQAAVISRRTFGLCARDLQPQRRLIPVTTSSDHTALRNDGRDMAIGVVYSHELLRGPTGDHMGATALKLTGQFDDINGRYALSSAAALFSARFFYDVIKMRTLYDVMTCQLDVVIYKY